MALLFGRGAAYLLVRAVFVMFYRAGADENICAVDRADQQGQGRRSLTGHIRQQLSLPSRSTHRSHIQKHYFTHPQNSFPQTWLDVRLLRTYFSICAISLTASTPPGSGSRSMKKPLDSQILMAFSWN